MPIAGTFGNVYRGLFRGPGLVDFDTSLFKKFSITGDYRDGYDLAATPARAELLF